MKNCLAIVTLVSLYIVQSCSHKKLEEEKIHNREEVQTFQIDINEMDSMVLFGTYHNMCKGNCFEPILIDLKQNKMYKDFSLLSIRDTSNRMVMIDVTSVEARDIIESLMEHFSLAEFKDYTPRIGCPDCRDHGGIYLKIHLSYDRYTFNIDPDSIPKKLYEPLYYLEKIHDYSISKRWSSHYNNDLLLK